MTLFNPNLRVNALKVFCNGKIAFFEKFHSGLNIIRGQNSSGKSTIMDFLFYGLGGDILEHQWRETAVQCDSVMLEVTFNGNVVTIQRDIEPAASRPMKMFYGNIEQASESALEGWEIYPYARRTKESFSQVLFRFLNLPEVEYGEENSKITINQILRLLYSDQMSPVEKIFRPQRWDHAIIRQAVGDLLCGAYDDDYYKAKLRKKEAVEEFNGLNSKIKFLTNTHSKEGHPLTSDWLEAEEAKLKQSLNELTAQIDELEAKIFSAEFDDRLTLNSQQATYQRVVELQQTIGNLEERITAAELEKADVIEYIGSIARKLNELHNSHSVVEEVGGLSFSFCPSCLAPITEDEIEGACSLCKSPHDPEKSQERVLKLINEYARQKERALSNQKKKDAELLQLRSSLQETTELWEQASRHYTVSLRNPTSEMRSSLRQLNQDAGYAYRRLEELAFIKSVIAEIAELAFTRDKLQKELDYLDATISAGKKAQEVRIGKARQEIEKNVLGFLKNDLARQSTFTSANRVNFEFDGDRLSVNDESYFSASSMVYLRNSFFAAFFYAAVNDPDFYHPRFMMMDTIEDKGLEPERSQNFQRQLWKMSSKAKSDHQIIIATSMIAEELNTPEITVGREYTHEHRTLSLSE